MRDKKTHLALGDSMSIDDYTGYAGGGAAKQFFHRLHGAWVLDDRTYDGCQMAGVPRDGRGDVVTLTVGGNDLLLNKAAYLHDGLGPFAEQHLELLEAIRTVNPTAIFIVGDIYAPAAPLDELERAGLEAANAAIRDNCRVVGAELAPIHDAFRGHESEYLCLAIEPTLKGATVIAELFHDAYRRSSSP